MISITTEDPAAVDALRQVGDAYKAAFNQDAVMYAVTAVPIITIYMTDFTPREILRLIALFFAEILNISAADVPIALVAHILL